jgi:hypothetical protein
VGTHREYTSVVFAGAEPLGTGHGATKQEAEQDAARAALQSLVGEAEPSGRTRPAVKTPRPRARRSPRTPRAIAPAEPDASAAVAEVIPLPEPAPEPEPEPKVVHSEPRSRQFGEPLE